MIYPSSVIGRSIGGFCAFAGVFILTLPIPIVVNVFSSCYKGKIWRIEMANKRKVKSAKQTKRGKEIYVNESGKISFQGNEN